MQQEDGKEDSKEEVELINSLKQILGENNLDSQQQLILRLSMELGVSVLDCAAALLKINQPTLFQNNQPAKLLTGQAAIKLARYRINVGRKHLVTLDEIKTVLVDVSGVDNQRIGRVEIRSHYTLVDLPEGMPADIFQLLAETEIRQRQLNLKRVKPKSHRGYIRRNKPHSFN